ncbi:cilia- and flagella-associated protein 44 [Amia ocellicauda]|uniref:cilia- and flagella-associated protein 44 n=1 Tax=Amia ocellicauda TaxID=2972642 RepID=UPI0034641CE5
MEEAQEMGIQPAGEQREGEDSSQQATHIPEDFYYDYEELQSRPFVSPDSGIPPNLLRLIHSFGYDCNRRANLQLLDEHTLGFVAGNLVVFLDLRSKEQRYLRSCSGGGIGIIMVHPSKEFLAVAEKGNQPDIIVYEYPSLRPYRILRGGTAEAYSFVDFNSAGSLLASVGSSPDYMLTLWDWRQEQVVLRCKAFSQDVYRVTFSTDNPGQLTTSGSGHIKFWKMASTFTGLKLQGMLGRFGKTTLTDIEGYVELPDGKVLSGSDWGNMLLWEGGLIKVEICRRGGQPCHAGPIHQFVLDEGELLTISTDGAVRVWDFEGIDTADAESDSGLFEMEPMNELVVGKDVSLLSMVKSFQPDSPIWFAQDASGAIWKLDLSFTNTTQDPECLFSFHAGGIQSMDTSTTSHLMATTALDKSVRVFDILAKQELTASQFKRGGTTLTWAPRLVNPKGGLLVVGFEDGVVRLLELLDPRGLAAVAGRGRYNGAELRLLQVFKPHTAPVSAIAYERNGEILATGSLDSTVFFFTVGERYEPVGFVRVPGPVRGLEWSPPSHERSTLLVLCENGHVLEIMTPEPKAQSSGQTFEIQGLPSRHFHFCSIKSRILRDAEVERRRVAREQRQKEREARLKKKQEQGQTLTEEDLAEETEPEEEELPTLHSPEPPSPLLCGLYSQPGAFWLSMGGYDSGFLYHCKFSEQQGGEQEPLQRADEPFSFLPVQDTDRDPIWTISFSSSRQLLLCGMQSGQVRLYPLPPHGPDLAAMQGFWALSLHDNQYGRLRAVRCSHDDQFVVTAGEDGNMFMLSLLPAEDLQAALDKKARVPSPREGLEKEKVVEDIEDPNAYSIEMAKQRTELERMQREAELRRAGRRLELEELRLQFTQKLQLNQSHSEHGRLDRAEFELDPRIVQEYERLMGQRVRETCRELAWDLEKHRVRLQKLQQWYLDNLESNTVAVKAFQSDHMVFTYRLLAPSRKLQQQKDQGRRPSQLGMERRRSRVDFSHESSYPEAIPEDVDSEDVLLQRQGMRGAGKLSGRQAEKLQKAMEKAERVRARIQKRKNEWEELYSSKPDENFEDPQDVQAIRMAQENMGDFKLKTAKDFTVPEHLRMNAEKKRMQLVALEEKINELKTDMNDKIMALRDFKSLSIAHIKDCVRQLRAVQRHLPPAKRQPLPSVPRLLPEETPENKLRCTRAKLLKYKELRARQARTAQLEEREGGFGGLGSELTASQEEEQEEEEEEEDQEEDDTGVPTQDSQGPSEQHAITPFDMEEEQQQETQSLFLQGHLLKQVEELVQSFDLKLYELRSKKLQLDRHLKQSDLQHITLFEELQLLKEFEKSENTLLERVNARSQEELELQGKYEECQQQLEAKRRDIAKLQERDRALTTTFQASLGENNKFADFLTKVFKKKVKRAKKKEKKGEEEEELESEEESEEESEWSDEELDSGSESGPLDDSVCPPYCDPALFENTIQLREKRLDLEEALLEEKKAADILRKECDSLTKKMKVVSASLSTAEGDLELLQREKQQKLNELDVMLTLQLHQMEFVNYRSMLTQALVLDKSALEALERRIQELQQENRQQSELYRQARQQHVQLLHNHRDMEAKIQELEARCEKVMLMKFGRLLDLEALQMQTLSVSRNLEELKQESSEREAIFTHQLQELEDEVRKATEAQTEVIRLHTDRLWRLDQLMTENKELEERLDSRQRKMGVQLPGRRLAEQDERRRLIQLVETQAQESQALRQEISLLSRKGGHILPPAQPPQPLQDGIGRPAHRGGHSNPLSRHSVPATGQSLS